MGCTVSLEDLGFVRFSGLSSSSDFMKQAFKSILHRMRSMPRFW